MIQSRRLALLTMVIGVLAPLSASGKPGVVILKDGKEHTGDVTQTATEVKVVEKGITLTFPMDKIKEVRLQKSVDEQYKEKLAALDDKDVEGHYELALWCRQQERYDLVRVEAVKVLRLNDKHENALLLLKLAKEKLEEAKKQDGGKASTRPGAAPAGAMLSEAAVQRIRLLEYPLDMRLPDVRVEFARGFIERFLEDMSGDPDLDSRQDREEFKRLRPWRQLQIILQASDPVDKYAPYIRIANDPPVFDDFRKRIQPVVMRSCATAGCHNATSPSRFRLFDDRLRPTESTYTNFYILDVVETPSGPLIDRDRPEESVLLKWGLPDTNADEAHPKTQYTIKPMFKGRNDPNYRIFRDWIGRLTIPRPAYGIGGEPAPEEPKESPPAEPSAKDAATKEPAPPAK